jgi:hypothetical protein
MLAVVVTSIHGLFIFIIKGHPGFSHGLFCSPQAPALNSRKQLTCLRFFEINIIRWEDYNETIVPVFKNLSMVFHPGHRGHVSGDNLGYV